MSMKQLGKAVNFPMLINILYSLQAIEIGSFACFIHFYTENR